jgi:hypothetical protein
MEGEKDVRMTKHVLVLLIIGSVGPVHVSTQPITADFPITASIGGDPAADRAAVRPADFFCPHNDKLYQFRSPDAGG